MHNKMNTLTKFSFSILLICFGIVKGQEFSIATNSFLYFDISSYCPSLTAEDDSTIFKLFTHGKLNSPSIFAAKGLYDQPLKNKDFALGASFLYENSFLKENQLFPVEDKTNTYYASKSISYNISQNFSMGLRVGILSSKSKSIVHVSSDSVSINNRSKINTLGIFGFSYNNNKSIFALNFNFETLINKKVQQSKSYSSFMTFYANHTFKLKNGIISPYVLTGCELTDFKSIATIILPLKYGVFYQQNMLFLNAEFTLFNDLALSFGKEFMNNRLKVSLSYIFYDLYSKNSKVFDNENLNLSNIIIYK